MNIHHRDLVLGVSGGDVRLAHGLLRRLGFAVSLTERQNETHGETTRNAVRRFQADSGLVVSGEIDFLTCEALKRKAGQIASPDSYSVHGTVRESDGTPCPGLWVRVVNVDFRREQLLGEVETDTYGQYSVQFNASAFSTRELRGPDLLVRAFSSGVARATSAGLTAPGFTHNDTSDVAPGGLTPLASSSIVFDAGADTTIDLLIGGGVFRGPSEFDRIRADLVVLVDDFSIADLNDDDLAFLAGETDYSIDWLRDFVIAARFSDQTALAPDAVSTTPSTRVAPQAFYGWIRDGLPADLPQLIAQPVQALVSALRRAFDDNIIAAKPPLPDWIDQRVQDLHSWAVNQAFREPAMAPALGRVAGVIGTVSVDETVQKNLLSAYLTHTSRMPDFWSTVVPPILGGDAALVGRLQRAVQFSALTRGHLPLVQKLHERWDSPSPGQSYQTIGDMLAPMTEADWDALIAATGAPPDAPGVTVSERNQTYRTILMGLVEAGFPTHYLAHRISAATALPNVDAVTGFLQANANQFNLLKEPVDNYLHRNPGAVADAPAGTAESLRQLQRIYKVAPHVDHAVAITNLPTQPSSAREIVRMGREGFITAVSESIPADTAGQIYDASSAVADASSAILASYAGAYDTEVALVPKRVPPEFRPRIPDYATLFGPLDFCACEHCRSVYSPAAYLVDLLATLDKVPINNKTAKAYLYYDHGTAPTLRRADIGQIPLTCANTNTPLPYIDLANEVLEQIVFDPTANPAPALSTTRTAEELSVTPEHVIASVYDTTLAQAVYPSSLPFDLGLEEARTFLGQLGVRRPELMREFQDASGNGTPTDGEIAAETLGLSPIERAILSGTDSHRGWEYFNLQQNANTVVDPFSDADPPATVTKDWLEVLSYGYHFVRRAGITQQDFVDLFTRTVFAQNLLGAPILTWPETECDAGKALINGLSTEDAAKSLHRFLRLQRNLGCPIIDLDRMLHVFYSGTFGDDLLQALARFQSLRATVDKPLTEVLAWFGNIETSPVPTGDPSPYDAIFLNTTYNTQVAEITALTLNGNRTDLQNAGKISDHLPVIAAAVGLTVSDVEVLITKGTSPIPDSMSLLNLTRIYRVASLCRVVGISVLDFLTLQGFISWDPFSAQVDKIDDYLALVETIRSSNFSITELDYILGHNYTAASDVAPAPEAVGVVLAELHDGLRKIARETGYPKLLSTDAFPAPDAHGLLTHRELVSALSPDLAEQFFNLVGRSFQNADNPGSVYASFNAHDAIGGSGSAIDVPRYVTVSCSPDWDGGDITLTGHDALGTSQTETIPCVPGRRTIGTKKFKDVTSAAKSAIGSLTATCSVGTLVPWNFGSDVDPGSVLREFTADSVSPITGSYVSPELPSRIALTFGPGWDGGDVTVEGTASTGAIQSEVFAANDGKTVIGGMLFKTVTSATHSQNGSANRSGTVGVFRGADISECVTVDGIRAAFASGVVAANAKISGTFRALDVPRYVAVSFNGAWDGGDIMIEGLDKNGGQIAETFHPTPQQSQTIVGTTEFFTFSDATKTADGTANNGGLASIGTAVKTARDVAWFTAYNNQLVDAVIATIDPAEATITRADAKKQLVDDGTLLAPHPRPGITDSAQCFAYVLAPLSKYVSKLQSEALVTKKIAEALKLDLRSSGLLLNSLDAASHRYLSTFTDPGALASIAAVAEQPGNPFKGQFDAYRALDKATTVVLKFRIPPAELAVYLQIAPNIGWLALNTLPTSPPAKPPAYLTAWRRTADLFALRDELPRVNPSLIEFFRDANDRNRLPGFSDVENALAQIVGWSASDLDDLATSIGRHNDFSLFQDEVGLQRVKNCFDLLRRLGVPVRKAASWRLAELKLAEALEIRSAVKSRYDQATWLSVAKPIQSGFREKQRDALVAYLGGKYSLTPDQLFEKYLIDVEMSSCMLTSRIKQAISSVQLFFQRAAMFIETDGKGNPVQLTPDVANQWKTWFDSYGTWEANRKVFLYPENWIEPQLRADKTPFFVEFEKALTQGDVTLDTAEQAFLGYLEKLDIVGNVEVRAIYLETETHTIHVFARTRATPHKYYYRRQIGHRIWTPWEKVDLDITGDHLLATIFNRRLHLFWPLVTEKTDPAPADRGNKDTPGPPPSKYQEFKLAWSEYRTGKWTPKRMTDETITTMPNTNIPPHVLEMRAISGSDLAAIAGDEFKGQPDDLCIIVMSAFCTSVGWFVFSGTGSILTYDVVSGDTRVSIAAVNEVLPDGTRVDYMFYRCLEGINTASLWKLGGKPLELLNSTPNNYTLVPTRDYLTDMVSWPYVYRDRSRQYLIVQAQLTQSPSEWADANYADPGMILESGSIGQYAGPNFNDWLTKGTDFYQFSTLYHPQAGEFTKRLNENGIDRLLAPDSQSKLAAAPSFFDQYAPQQGVNNNLYPFEDVDFSIRGAYSTYNWELFFHAPLFVAERLTQNQRFADARKWFHYIFDPTTGDIKTAWKFQPFVGLLSDPIATLLALLDYAGTDQKLLDARQEMIDDIYYWRNDPFDPHLVARHRISAYQKTVVMKYVDNLIAWGDQLFRQDTIESINQATLLYVLAGEILGPRPKEFPDRGVVPSKSFEDLVATGLDKFSNAAVKLEGWMPPGFKLPPPKVPLPDGEVLYFCVPPNDVLLGYWDKVTDRLFKIRHCLNIEGVFQKLPLFEPPLDPGMLIRAKAAGVDLSTALSDTQTSLPKYRFATLYQKALDFNGDVRSLGGALLSALEKKDGEHLALLRSGHELSLLNAARDVRQRQVDEAQAQIDALNGSLAVAQARYDFYSSREFINVLEAAHLALTLQSAALHDVAASQEAAAAIIRLIPQFNLGVAGWAASPTTTVLYGGEQVGSALQAFAGSLRALANNFGTAASLSQTMGSYQRRQEDWSFQADAAQKEMTQISKQIDAAQIRLEISQKELANHDLQIANAQQADDYMHSKFTNEDLYDWMVGQIAGVYLQSYQLAYDLAKRAEKAFQFEIGDDTTTFIQFGYWDSLKKGLLAGERLQYDLRRMEAAYLERNTREFEITKHVSLASLYPLQLAVLKATGTCTIDLAESLYDADFPGHYMRRIKSVSVTIPCTTGPYVGVNCRLTLLKNAVRKDPSPGKSYAESPPAADPRFRYDFTSAQSIVTSTGQNDSGLFELNFRDERFLPCEGAGVISSWRFDLGQSNNNFDVRTVSDVILHLRYTARDGGPALAAAVPARPTAGVRFFSAKHDFPSQWYSFLHPVAKATSQSLQLGMTLDRFPFAVQQRGDGVRSTKLRVMIRLASGQTPTPVQVTLHPPGEPQPPAQSRNVDDQSLGTLVMKDFLIVDQLGTWALEVKKSDIPVALQDPNNDNFIDQTKIDDVGLFFFYG